MKKLLIPIDFSDTSEAAIHFGLQLAEKCGLHRSTISLVESKKRMPSILVCLKIAKALDKNIKSMI